MAVAVLRELYATGARKVPAGAPAGFVPTRWAGYLDRGTETGDVTAYRHYWELCVLMALRDGLRVGRRVRARARAATPTRLVTCSPPSSGNRERAEFCQLVGKPATRRPMRWRGRRGAAHGARRIWSGARDRRRRARCGSTTAGELVIRS